MTAKPNIFEYINYREFLTDWRKAEKENDPGFSHDYLCAKLGLKTRSYFIDIEKGRRSIGPDLLNRMIKLIGLSKNEADYFRALIRYGQKNATSEEKEYWFERIVQLNNTPKKIVDKKTYLYFRKWYHATVRSYLETGNFKGDYTIAAKDLYNRVSPKEIREAVANLKALDLIAPDKNGFLKPTDKVLTTGEIVRDELLRQYQLANHDILRTILDKNEPHSHESSQLTISISRKGMERIISRVKQLRSEIMSIVHKDEDESDRVYKIAIHVYPESRKG
jgi:uncharacterized protein (TIGR02147 family)